ncbi:MAG: transposase [Saprospiraceae bacterium]|nr:transposase [Saprospiraceae bacterium]
MSKALGSYCGVVPFGKESGRYKGKDKVSPIANKTLKTLLHLGALATLAEKCIRSILPKKNHKEKKNKMLAINNVRNKILKHSLRVLKIKPNTHRLFVQCA